MLKPLDDKNSDFKIWEGFYTSFTEAHATKTTNEHVFNRNILWRKRLEKKLAYALHDISEAETLLPNSIRYDTPFEMILTMMVSKSAQVKVLDFGGGIGLHFIQAQKTIKLDTSNIQYDIVELPELAQLGKEKLSHLEQLHFFNDLPPLCQYDLVHMGSSLQYIEDWKGLLTRLSQYTPQYFILADVIAGKNPSFVTQQYYYGDRIPVWFLNINELLEHFTKHGYQLIYASKHHAKILGHIGSLPTEHFPTAYKLDATCHLVLQRNTK